MQNAIRLSLILSIALVSIGCGGGKEAKKPTVQTSGGLTSSVAQAKIAAPGKSDNKNKKAKATVEEAPPVQFEPDDYLVENEAPPMELTGQVPETEELGLVALEEGANSEDYIVSNDKNNNPNQTLKSSQGIPPTVRMVPPGTLGNSLNTSQENGVAHERIPEGFVSVPEYGVGPGGLPWRLRCEKDSKEMALIPGGVFIRGTTEGSAECMPQREVYLEDFYMDVYEVTLREYEALRVAYKKDKGRPLNPPVNLPKDLTQLDPDLPALGMNWGEAKFYATFHGKQLPTEAQWEKAARGEKGFRFPWGNGRVLWEMPRIQAQIDPVGTFRSDISPYGIYDMCGNAREWCLDWYSEKSYAEDPVVDGAIRNPLGAKVASLKQHRVLRGNSADWSVWSRNSQEMGNRPKDAGIRCVLNLKAATPPKEETETETKTKTKEKKSRTR